MQDVAKGYRIETTSEEVKSSLCREAHKMLRFFRRENFPQSYINTYITALKNARDTMLFLGMPNRYECLACGTLFTEKDAEYKSGHMVCPSCWHEDIRRR